jgi:hypothetical protein
VANTVGGSVTLTKLTPGTSGYFLKSEGAGSPLVWSNVAAVGSATPAALSAGDFLVGGPFNGASVATFDVQGDTANTANKLVARNGSGDIIVSKINATDITASSTISGTTITGSTKLVGHVNEANTNKNVFGNNITAGSTISGTTITASSTISGTTITGSTKLVGHVNESNTTKNVFGNTITAGSTISGTTITAGTKLVGHVNEANTTKNVFGSTITAGSTISGTTITAGTKFVGHVNEANTTKNVFGSTITAGSTISGTTITAGTKLVGHVNESNTTKNVFGNTITVGTDGFIDSTFINNGVIYANTSKKLVSTAVGTDGEVLTLAGGIPTWATATGSSGGSYWTEHTNGNDVYYNSGNVGISNAAPTHTLDIGSNVAVIDDGVDKLYIRGNVYSTHHIIALGTVHCKEIVAVNSRIKNSTVVTEAPTRQIRLI